MTLRPKPLPPDTRPDWRDPNIPCHFWGKIIPAWYIHDESVDIMRDYDLRPDVYADENWRNDPTYNLRAKRVKGND